MPDPIVEARIIASLRVELARKEIDNRAMAQRLHRYEDVLTAIAALDHTQVQRAIPWAREALKA